MNDDILKKQQQEQEQQPSSSSSSGLGCRERERVAVQFGSMRGLPVQSCRSTTIALSIRYKKIA